MTLNGESPSRQRITVYQQNGSGEAKIAGIRRYGGQRIGLTCIANRSTAASRPR